MPCSKANVGIRSIKKDGVTIGRRIECSECGHVGKDRIYAEDVVKFDGPGVYYDLDKAEKVCFLDKGRHAPRQRVGGARPRDSQRTRLYAAERAAFEPTVHHAPITVHGGVEDVQRWLDEKVLGTRWFRSRWGAKNVRIVAGKGCHARYQGNITLARWGYTPWTVLHELAHVLASPSSVAAHGKQFAAVYLFLVQQTLGDEAAKLLRAEFVARRVKHRDSSYIPKAGAERVATKTQVAAYKRRVAEEQKKVVLGALRQSQAAETIRAAIKAGSFGAPGTKQRAAALAVARTLDPVSPRK